MDIMTATSAHVPQIARLFDLYRQFYDCAPDLELASAFVAERIGNRESTVFVALEGSEARGFVQLYPSFCSVDAVRILILYDLYVDSSARGKGVGEALMNRATEYARETGAARIDLLTGKDNLVGLNLYEKLGYYRSNEEFYSYSLDVASR